MKYTNQELEEALNAIDVSTATKTTIESDLQHRHEVAFWGYTAISIGIICIILSFVVTLLFVAQKEDVPRGTDTCLWFGAFVIAWGTARLKRIRMRKAVIELMLKQHEANDALDRRG